MLPNRIKRILALVLDAVGVCRVGLWLQRKIYGRHIRAINYHSIADRDIANFEEQLKFYSGHFVGVEYEKLAGLLETGDWPNDRPGLIISFDDGDVSHFETAAPMLEKYGFTGWFFVPSQERGMSDAQLRGLAARHVIGSHTRSHCRMIRSVSPQIMVDEIEGSKSDLEKIVDRPVDIFAWVGGEEDSYSREAAEMIRRTYRFAFMTNSAVVTAASDPHQLQRTNVEANCPLWLVRFQLSGLMDVFYYFKRRRVNRLTA